MCKQKFAKITSIECPRSVKTANSPLIILNAEEARKQNEDC